MAYASRDFLQRRKFRRPHVWAYLYRNPISRACAYCSGNASRARTLAHARARLSLRQAGVGTPPRSGDTGRINQTHITPSAGRTIGGRVSSAPSCYSPATLADVRSSRRLIENLFSKSARLGLTSMRVPGRVSTRDLLWKCPAVMP